MRSYEFVVTLASGFAAPSVTKQADGGVVELRQRARRIGKREAELEALDRDLVEHRKAGQVRPADAKGASRDFG